MNGDGPNAEVFPDLHLKMSKKIAQLTRVIYHLNAKNEDNAAELASYREQHNSEVSLILEDAMGKLNEFQAKLDERNASNEAEKAVKALQKKHADEKRKAMEQFKSFKARVQDRETAINQAVQDKMTKLRAEVAAIKDKFAARTTELEGLAGQLKNSANISQASLEEMRAKHKEEVDRLVKDSNEKYQSMLMQKLDEADTLKEQHEAALRESAATHAAEVAAARAAHEAAESELRAKLAKLQAELDGVQDTLGSKLESLLQNVEALQEQKQQLAKDNGALADQVNALQARIGEMQQKIEGKDKLLQDAEGSSKDQLAALRRDLAARDAKLQAQDADMTSLSTQLQEQMAVAAKLKAELRKAGGASQAAVQALEKKLAAAEKARAAAEKQLVATQKVLDDTKNKMAELVASKVQLEEDRDTLQSRVRELEARVAALEKESQSSSAAQGEALATCRKDLAKATADAEALRQRVAALEAAEKAAAAKHALAVKALAAEHAQDVATQAAGHAQEREALQAKLRDAEAAWARKEATLKKQAEEAAAAGDARAAELERQLAALRDGEHKQLQEEHTAMTSEIKVLKRKIESLQQAEAAAGRDLQESRAREAKAKGLVADMTARLPQQLADARGKAEAALEQQLRAEFAATLGNETAALRQEYERMMAARQDSQGSAHAATLAKVRAELEGARADQLAAEADHAAALAKLRAEHEAERARHKQALVDAEKAANEAEQRHLAAMNALQQRLGEDGAAQAAELRADFERREKEAAAAHAATLEKLRGEHAATVRDMEAELDTVRKDALAAFTKELADKLEKAGLAHEERLEQELARLAAKKNEEKAAVRRALDKKVSDLGRDVADLTKMCGAAEARGKELEGENVQLRKRAEDLRRELDKQGKSGKREQEAARKKLRAAHKAELEGLVREHIAETEVLNQEFQRVQEVMTQQNDLLEQRLAEVQDLYNRRGSRPEDLERIAGLTAENAALADEVAKLVKDMKYYKLELLNREKNFNKLFNASPNVGVMSVLKTSVPNTGPRASMGGGGGGGNPMAGSGAMNVGSVAHPASAGPQRSGKKQPSSRSRSRSQTRR